MATTQLFKNTAKEAHRKRYMTNESDFSKGMQFTNAPLSSGYAKAIINFDLKNDGASLVPRGGLHDVQRKVASIPMDTLATDYFIHHADAAYVSNYNETDAYLCNYFILCKSFGSASPDIASAKLMLEYNNNFLGVKLVMNFNLNACHFLNHPWMFAPLSFWISANKSDHSTQLMISINQESCQPFKSQLVFPNPSTNRQHLLF